MGQDQALIKTAPITDVEAHKLAQDMSEVFRSWGMSNQDSHVFYLVAKSLKRRGWTLK